MEDSSRTLKALSAVVLLTASSWPGSPATHYRRVADAAVRRVVAAWRAAAAGQGDAGRVGFMNLTEKGHTEVEGADPNWEFRTHVPEWFSRVRRGPFPNSGKCL